MDGASTAVFGIKDIAARMEGEGFGFRAIDAILPTMTVKERTADPVMFQLPLP